MKKIFIITAVAAVLGTASAYAQENFARAKLSLFPPVATTSKKVVSGLDFGLIATHTDKLEGAQIGLVYAGVSKKSTGAQMGLYAGSNDFDGAKWGAVAVTRDLRGYSNGFVTICRNVIGYEQGVYTQNKSIRGLQFGMVNVSKSVSGMQFGLVNYTEEMNGVQIGLLNIITKSSLPVMIIFNYQFK